MESSRFSALTITAAIGGVATVLLELLLFLPGSPAGSYLEVTFGVSTVLMIQLLLGALGIVLLAYPIYAIALAAIRWRRTFDAGIGKNRFLLGETVSFKSWFKGQLNHGLFTAMVLFPNGHKEFWPDYRTFHRSDVGDLGVLNGRTKHEAEWSQKILPNYPIGKYVARIGVWDRKDFASNNLPVKEKSTSFWVLPPGYRGTPSASGVISSSGDTGFVQIMQNSPLIITDADVKSDSIQKLVVRFPHGEIREHEVRFYYVKVRNEGEKTVDDVIAYCGANQIRFIPSTEKSTFGVDLEESETLEEFDRFGIESYVVALLRDHRKVKDEIKYIHPGPVGESFVLFFTLKGYGDRVYVPAHTRVPHNIYGGEYEGRVIGHPEGIIRLYLSVEGRDIQGCTAEFEINFDNWKTFRVKRLHSTNEL
jgi:hypothetical protein